MDFENRVAWGGTGRVKSVQLLSVWPLDRLLNQRKGRVDEITVELTCRDTDGLEQMGKNYTFTLDTPDVGQCIDGRPVPREDAQLAGVRCEPNSREEMICGADSSVDIKIYDKLLQDKLQSEEPVLLSEYWVTPP